MTDPGRERQSEIYLAGLAGRRQAVPVGQARLEERAREVMSEEAFAYVAGGAGSEATVRANRAAFDRWRVVPRVLKGAASRDFSLPLFGARLPAPLLLAPVGVLDMAHPKADLAVARAAASLGVPFVFSSQASVPMEVCAGAMGDSPRWFQLYWNQSDAVMESLVRRAEGCGCGAIVLTLDTAYLGWRPRDLDLGYLPFAHGRGIAQYTSDPVFRAGLGQPAETTPGPRPRLTLATLAAALEMARRYPGGLLKNLWSAQPRLAVQRFLATFPRPSLAWPDLPRLLRLTKLPVLLKGVLHPDDARRAVQAGVAGVVVSNHGGRQLDGAVAALDALPGVVEAVGGRVPVLMDSGIRGGADVFKAIALGAAAVLVGRPYVYGLAIAGQAGVSEVVRNLIAELDLTMGLAGCGSLGEVTRAMLEPAS